MSLGRLTLAVAGVLVACSSVAQVGPTKSGYLFRAKHIVGKIYHYQVSVKAMGVSAMTADEVQTLKVANGIASVAVTVSPTKVLTRKVMPKHNMLRVDAQNQSQTRYGLPLVMAQFPKPPVRPGGVWTGISSFPTGASEGGTLSTSYHFSSINKDHGRFIAVLDVVLKGFAKGDGAMLIDMTDGSVLASSLSLHVTLPDGSVEDIQVAIKRR